MHQFSEQLVCRSITKTENEDRNESVSKVPHGVKEFSDIESCKMPLFISFSCRNTLAKDLERKKLYHYKTHWYHLAKSKKLHFGDF